MFYNSIHEIPFRPDLPSLFCLKSTEIYRERRSAYLLNCLEMLTGLPRVSIRLFRMIHCYSRLSTTPCSPSSTVVSKPALIATERCEYRILTWKDCLRGASKTKKPHWVLGTDVLWVYQDPIVPSYWMLQRSFRLRNWMWYIIPFTSTFLVLIFI